MEDGQESRLGSRRSGEIWDCLRERGYINDSGEIMGTWAPEQLGFTVGLPAEYAGYEDEVIKIVDSCKIETIVKPKRKRKTRTLNKQVYATPEFEAFWEKITQRTTYRVSFKRNALVDKCVARIKAAPSVDPIRLQITRTGVEITRGGAKGSVLGTRDHYLTDSYPLPDIVSQASGSNLADEKDDH